MSSEPAPRPSGTLRLLARLVPLVFVLVVLGGVALAWKEASAARPRPGPQGNGGASVEEALSPRDAVRAFVRACRSEDYGRAARLLDVSAVQAEPDSEEAADLARQLELVLRRKVWLDLNLISDAPGGDVDDGFEADLESIATIDSDHGAVRILLARGDVDPRTWRFSSYTVAAIPQLYGEHGYGWIEEHLPESFFQISLLDVELWQWIGLLLAAVAASVVGFVFTLLVVFVLRIFVGRTETEWDDWLLEGAVAPLRLAASVVAFWFLSLLLTLDAAAQEFVGHACQAATVVAITWLLLRGVDVLARTVHARMARKDESAAATLVPMGRRITKAFVVVIAGVSLINNLGFNVAGLITGLGVGGLAVALAAQKTLENLFGGISVIADKPVEVGQFCRVGEHVGTVEEIGLRSTRLRTLERSVVTVPNAEFSTARIENLALRDRMRILMVIQVGYDTTPDQMRWLLVELRRMLHAHPRIVEDPVRVRFKDLGAHSLDIEVMTFVDTEDWNDYLAVREDVNLRILAIVERSGTYFAYPSQTLYLGRDGGKDPERTAGVEEEVRAWREEGRLPFPNLPPEEARELRGTLDYPPEGAPPVPEA